MIVWGEQSDKSFFAKGCNTLFVSPVLTMDKKELLFLGLEVMLVSLVQ